MGIEYYLLKEYDNEIFELGKGAWLNVFSRDLGKLEMDRFDLYKKILGEAAWDFAPSLTLGYFEKLSESIHRWCGDRPVRLIDDVNNGEDIPKYRMTGTRFTA